MLAASEMNITEPIPIPTTGQGINSGGRYPITIAISALALMLISTGNQSQHAADQSQQHRLGQYQPHQPAAGDADAAEDAELPAAGCARRP